MNTVLTLDGAGFLTRNSDISIFGFTFLTDLQIFGRNDDGFSVPIRWIYLVQWSVFFTFYLAHWEKYITGVSR